MSIASGVGLTSGIDFNSIIAQMRQVNSRPISLLAQKGSLIQAREKSMDAIASAVQAFAEAADPLTKQANFLSLTVTSSDRNIVTASVDETATAGSFNVKVLQLAQSSRIASQGVASLTTTSIAAGDGVFSFKVGTGATKSVNVHAGMNLQELADSINNLEGAGVRASVINDGTATNPYRLVLSAEETGAASSVTIQTNNTTLNLSTNSIEAAYAKTGNGFDGTVTSSGTYTGAKTKNIVAEITTGGAVGVAKYRVSYDGGLTWTANDAFTTSGSAVDVTGAAAEGVNLAFAAGTANFAVGDRFSVDAFAPTLQEARDAVVEVDGIQISRSTNTFEDVVEGVTFNAVKVSADTQTLTVAANTATAQGQIKSFVEAYNKLIDMVTAQTKYDVDKKTAAPLFGDSGMGALLNSLRSSVTGIVPGLGELNSLSSVGITVDKNGKLLLDSAKLGDKLKEDPEAVAAIFVQTGKSSSSLVKFVSSTSATKTGAFSVNITQAAEQANVTGTQVLAGTLAANESVTIVVGENSTAIVNLTAGQTLAQIVQTINAELEKKGIAAAASDNGGALRIGTTAYGSDQKISVTSNKAAAAGQLGFGSTALTDTGLDVAGTINGIVAKGEGQRLSGNKGTDIEGLQLDITATSPMKATLNVTRGIASLLDQQLDSINNTTDGLFVSRKKSFQKQVKDIEDRIGIMQERLNKQDEALRKRFNDLEQKLNTMQSQGNQLISQLASLIAQ